MPVQGEDFYNRVTIRDDILKITVTDKFKGSVWLAGERQVGKTSLLKHIDQRHPVEDRTHSFLTGIGQARITCSVQSASSTV